MSVVMEPADRRINLGTYVGGGPYQPPFSSWSPGYLPPTLTPEPILPPPPPPPWDSVALGCLPNPEPNHQIVAIRKLTRLERAIKLIIVLHAVSLAGHGVALAKILGYLEV